MSKLKDILKPIGGFDLAKIDPTATGKTSLSPPLISEVFAVLDRNNDQHITAREFLRLCLEKC